MLQNQSQQGLILEDHHQYHQAAALGMMGFLSNQNPSSNNLAFLQPHGLNDQPISIKPFGSMLSPWTLSDEVDADEGDDLNGQATTSTDLCQSLCADQNPREFHHQDPYNLVGGKKKKSLVGVSELRVKKMKGRRKTREPRFCFKTLTDVDVLDDGYKWRKYGQKVVKNTHHPRSYYRCTQDNCRVKKRVERLAEDPRMVITTYEGRHVHSPCPDNPDDDSNKSLPILNNFF